MLRLLRKACADPLSLISSNLAHSVLVRQNRFAMILPVGVMSLQTFFSGAGAVAGCDTVCCAKTGEPTNAIEAKTVRNIILLPCFAPAPTVSPSFVRHNARYRQLFLKYKVESSFRPDRDMLDDSLRVVSCHGDQSAEPGLLRLSGAPLIFLNP